MPNSEHHSLWRISEFERLRQHGAGSALAGLSGPTVLSSTLQAELSVLERRQQAADALEVFAVCLRLREPVLIYLQCNQRVWPVTLFPAEQLYHSPRSLLENSPYFLAAVETLEVVPPGVRPPGHAMHERVAQSSLYHPLVPALWRLALEGPRSALLSEIGGTAAYRILRNPHHDKLPTPGALAPAVANLRREPAALRKIALWPGMSVERGSRLLNALYLTSNLMVTRSYPSAQPEPDAPLPHRRQ